MVLYILFYDFKYLKDFLLPQDVGNDMECCLYVIYIEVLKRKFDNICLVSQVFCSSSGLQSYNYMHLCSVDMWIVWKFKLILLFQVFFSSSVWGKYTSTPTPTYRKQYCSLQVQVSEHLRPYKPSMLIHTLGIVHQHPIKSD